jgi:hypothetical protein
MKIDRENFWNTIEEWTDTKSDSLHLFSNKLFFLYPKNDIINLIISFLFLFFPTQTASEPLL